MIQKNQLLHIQTSYFLPPLGQQIIYQSKNQQQQQLNKGWFQTIFNLKYIQILKDIKNQFSFFQFSNKKTRNMYNQYKDISLAILSNANSSLKAMKKSLQYKIPYVQIYVCSDKQQNIIKERILKTMQISHFMNQSFVVYGQIIRKQNQKQQQQQFLHPSQLFNEIRTWKQMQIRWKKKGCILFRWGSYVYGQLLIQKLEQVEDQTILQSFKIMRNLYYQKRRQRQQMKQRQQRIQQYDNNHQNQQLLSNKSNQMNIASGVVKIKMDIQIRQQDALLKSYEYEQNSNSNINFRQKRTIQDYSPISQNNNNSNQMENQSFDSEDNDNFNDDNRQNNNFNDSSSEGQIQNSQDKQKIIDQRIDIQENQKDDKIKDQQSQQKDIN